MDAARPDAGFDWAERFDEAARATMTGSPDAPGDAGLPRLRRGRAHTRPLHPAAQPRGARRRRGAGRDVLVDGYADGSLSMTAYTLDLAGGAPVHGDGAAGTVPAGIAPEDSNILRNRGDQRP